MTRLGGSAIGLALFTLLPSCVDTSALEYVPVDAGTADATSPACIQCVTGTDGPCGATYEQCTPFALCTELMQCLIDRGCLTISVTADRVTCGLSCIQGGVSGEDPAIVALTQVNICAIQSCNDACITP